MRAQWIKSQSEFESISQKWDELLVQTDPTNPFLSSHFILTWWKHYKDRYGIKILVLYEGYDLVAGLPLYEDCFSFPFQSIRFLYYLGGAVANYTEPLVKGRRPDYLGALFQWLHTEKTWDILHFKNVRHGHPLIEFSIKNSSSFVIQGHMNWAVDLSQGVDSYFKSRSKKLLKDLRSKRKQLIREYGAISLLSISGEDKIKEHLKIYRDCSVQSFYSRAQKNNFEDMLYFNFFQDFLILMEQKRKLRAYILKAGAKILALSFNLQLPNGFHWLLTGFNQEFHHFRPGYILTEETIRMLENEKQAYYNWYGHESFFKLQWCNKIEPLYRIKMVRKSLFNYGCHYAEELLRSNSVLKKWAKRLYGVS